jgi:uncharacterized NAD-dependent epimerase/dehydratase family protein
MPESEQVKKLIEKIKENDKRGLEIVKKDHLSVADMDKLDKMSKERQKMVDKVHELTGTQYKRETGKGSD